MILIETLYLFKRDTCWCLMLIKTWHIFRTNIFRTNTYWHLFMPDRSDQSLHYVVKSFNLKLILHNIYSTYSPINSTYLQSSLAFSQHLPSLFQQRAPKKYTSKICIQLFRNELWLRLRTVLFRSNRLLSRNAYFCSLARSLAGKWK